MVVEVYLKILLIVLFYAIGIFDNFLLADELFAKALQSHEIGVLEICVLSAESQTKFYERFKDT